MQKELEQKFKAQWDKELEKIKQMDEEMKKVKDEKREALKVEHEKKLEEIREAIAKR